MLALLFVTAPAVARAQADASARAAFARALFEAAARSDTIAVGALLSPRFADDAKGQLGAASTLLRRLGAQSAGLEIVAIDSLSAASTMVTVRSAGAPRLALVSIGWHRTEPGRLRYVQHLKSWDPAATRLSWSPVRSRDALVARLDTNIAALERLGAYSGTVLVARGDSVIFARGYGWANAAERVPNALHTRYHTASMGKMFTAVAIGQLVERGRLRLDDTLASVLPDYPNVERARQVTIRQLLEHTAGLGDLWSHPGNRRGPFASNTELAFAVSSGPLLFPPGSRWAYSNEGYTVLGAVIERVSGRGFEEYLRASVWEPAGMTSVAIGGADRPVPHRAIGYAPADSDVLGVEPLRPVAAILGRANPAQGAGGQYAAATDFLRFARALRGDRLLTRAMRDTLWAPRNRLPWSRTTHYASGFMRLAEGGHDWVGHGGGGGYGIDNMLYFSVDGPWTVVVLGNFNPPGATDLAASIATLLAGSDSP